MRAWLKGGAALLGMAVGLVAPPVALISWGRLPTFPLSVRDGSPLLVVLTVAGWVAWSAFALTTAGELARLCGRHRFIVRLPLLGRLQGLTASLVLAVVSLAGSASGGGTTAQAQPSRAPVEPPRPESPRPASPTAAAPQPVDTAVPTPCAAPSTTGAYVVAAGDDLWSVATTLLGDGTRWRELAAANPVVLADPTRRLEPGTRLLLPTAELPKTRVVEVRAGDTLSGLAAEHLGKASSWPRLAAANQRLVSDPDHIEVGWRLDLPDPPADGPPRAATDPAPSRVATDPSPAADRPSPPAEDPRPTTDDAPPAAATTDLPPSPQPTATPASSPETPARDVHVEDGSHDSTLIGTVGTLAAVGLVGGWELRRLRQQRARPPGRRAPQPDEQMLRLHAALGRRGAPDPVRTVEWSLRAIGRHCFETRTRLPELAQARLTRDELRFEWATPASPPPLGFTGDETCWSVKVDTDEPSVLEHPCAFPALVSLGTSETGETVMIDLERSGLLGIAATSSELQVAGLASMAVELACAPWAAETSVTVAGTDGGLAAVIGDEVTHSSDVQAALGALRKCVAGRREALRGTDLRLLRADPERAEAVAPCVYLFTDALDEATRAELDSLLTGEPSGVAVVTAVEDGSAASWSLFGDPTQPRGSFGRAATLAASTIPAATRDAVTALYALAEREPTQPAPWWNADVPRQPERRSREAVDIVSLHPAGHLVPEVMLIGPVDLAGAAGTEPSRSRTQLIELCSWLLEFPGRTAGEMAAGLGIAESTRRSNMSRLRTWLGTGPDGEPYLPDAYSGRIRLHPEVTSDVQKLRKLTAAGVNRLGERDLVAVLDLVRGELLADAAPGQWFWAEELRSDVTATLRDTGLVLVDLALAGGNLDTARWAAGRALVVAPDDELLLCARVRTEHAAGNRPAVQRLVSRLVEQARGLGVDLMPETVMLCQQVVEGRLRQRENHRPERAARPVAPLPATAGARRA